MSDSPLLRQDFIADKGATGGLIPKPEDPSDYVPVWLTTEYILPKSMVEKYQSLDSLRAFNDKKPPHYHCVRCWGEDYHVVDGERRCSTCHQESPGVILCYPAVCGSS